MQTYERIHLYYKREALGIKKDGFGRENVFKGQIGHMALDAIESTPDRFSVKPILRPLEAAEYNGDFKAVWFAVTKELDLPVWPVLTIQVWSEIINRLRDLGYDTDRLIERGLAILHEDYDIKSLL